VNIKQLVVFFIFWVSNFTIFAQVKTTKWFPEQSLFPVLEYDLLETQVYSGIFYLNPDTIKYKGAYIPVNLGIRKTFFQWDLLSMKFDIALGAGSYTQFEIIKYDQNTLQGGLLNTDFKASGFLNAEKGVHKFRMQIFHISSHLGDDYMLRNQNFELNNKTVNYEQIDITYLYQHKNVDYYLGLGEVISPNTFRERFMTELGVQANFPIISNLDIAFGSDIKFYHENNFEPDIHMGVGCTFKQQSKQQLNFSIDSYYGNLPYSTLNYGKVYWLGLSTRIFI